MNDKTPPAHSTNKITTIYTYTFASAVGEQIREIFILSKEGPYIGRGGSWGRCWCWVTECWLRSSDLERKGKEKRCGSSGEDFLCFGCLSKRTAGPKTCKVWFHNHSNTYKITVCEQIVLERSANLTFNCEQVRYSQNSGSKSKGASKLQCRIQSCSETPPVMALPKEKQKIEVHCDEIRVPDEDEVLLRRLIQRSKQVCLLMDGTKVRNWDKGNGQHQPSRPRTKSKTGCKTEQIP